MSGPCTSYAVSGDETSGPCLHPAGYLAQEDGEDGISELPYCACHYGDPYDPAECERAMRKTAYPEELVQKVLGPLDAASSDLGIDMRYAAVEILEALGYEEQSGIVATPDEMQRIMLENEANPQVMNAIYALQSGLLNEAPPEAKAKLLEVYRELGLVKSAWVADPHVVQS